MSEVGLDDFNAVGGVSGPAKAVLSVAAGVLVIQLSDPRRRSHGKSEGGEVACPIPYIGDIELDGQDVVVGGDRAEVLGEVVAVHVLPRKRVVVAAVGRGVGG